MNFKNLNKKVEIIQMNPFWNNGGHRGMDWHIYSAEKYLSTEKSISSKTILHKWEQNRDIPR